MTVNIRPLTTDHLEAAATLLAARHRADRARHPILPGRYGDPAVAQTVLQDLLAMEGMRGVSAWRAERLVGFLLGAPFLLPPAHVMAMWVRPRAVDIPHDGHAFAADESGTLAARLYAALAAPWVSHDGLVAHYVTVSADPETVEPWFNLGFGQSAALAVRDTALLPESERGHSDGISIRRAAATDLEAIQTLGTELFQSFAEPPIFLPFLPETAAAQRQYLADLLADPACPHWLAFANGRLVGMQIFVEPTSPHWSLGKLQTPERSVFLHWACTAADARGAGIGTTLTAHTLAWAREAGYDACAIYYMTASRAATFWQELGFRPVAHWLCRVVDERRTWATG